LPCSLPSRATMCSLWLLPEGSFQRMATSRIQVRSSCPRPRCLASVLYPLNMPLTCTVSSLSRQKDLSTAPLKSKLVPRAPVKWGSPMVPLVPLQRPPTKLRGMVVRAPTVCLRHAAEKGVPRLGKSQVELPPLSR